MILSACICLNLKQITFLGLLISSVKLWHVMHCKRYISIIASLSPLCLLGNDPAKLLYFFHIGSFQLCLRVCQLMEIKCYKGKHYIRLDIRNKRSGDCNVIYTVYTQNIY